jgi:hypothetical protein
MWIRKQLLQMQKMANFRKLCLICAHIMLIQIQGKLETATVFFTDLGKLNLLMVV